MARVSGGRRLRILFSRKPDWESMIAYGFRYTPHSITFGDVHTADLAGYDLVVPLTVCDLKYMDSVRHIIPHNPIPIPSLESLELCDDKQLFNRKLIDNGFAGVVPRIGVPLAYPYILKKRIDDYGTHSYIIPDARKEEALASVLTDPDYFTQQFIPGPNEFATHIISKAGRIVSSINIRYTFHKADPIKGKDKVEFIQLCGCPHLDLFTDILSLIGFEGLCCFNYKELNGRPYILEINPRFGSSLSRFFFAFTRRLT